ncbi:MAG: Lrp/AsnC family transcriptional regulator [Nanoarchaeota archaeon]
MNYKLDIKDKKLLYELDLNSRQSYNQLSKKIKLSKNSVINRISHLKESGIIKGFQTVLDVGKLGYISFRLNLKIQNASPEKEQEIINFLKKNENVVWIVSVEGTYNIASLILVKSIQEMNLLWNELLEKYQNFISYRFLAIMTEVSYYSRVFLLDKKQNNYEIKIITEPNEVKLDKNDKEILKLLVSNARMQIIDIASKLKITPKTVISRKKFLENQKIIIGYRTLFDYQKLGYQYIKLHLNLHNIFASKKQEFQEFIKNHPNIIYNDFVLGGDDFEIEMNIDNSEKLREIIDEIKKRFAGSIKDYHTELFYKEHKYIFLPTS